MTEPLSPETRAALEAAGPWQEWREATGLDWARMQFTASPYHRAFKRPDGQIVVVEYDAENTCRWYHLLPPPPGSACTSDDVSERVDQPDPLDEAANLLWLLPYKGNWADQIRDARRALEITVETAGRLHDQRMEGLENALADIEEAIEHIVKLKVRDALRDPEVRAEMFSDETP